MRRSTTEHMRQWQQQQPPQRQQQPPQRQQQQRQQQQLARGATSESQAIRELPAMCALQQVRVGVGPCVWSRRQRYTSQAGSGWMGPILVAPSRKSDYQVGLPSQIPSQITTAPPAGSSHLVDGADPIRHTVPQLLPHRCRRVPTQERRERFPRRDMKMVRDARRRGEPRRICCEIEPLARVVPIGRRPARCAVAALPPASQAHRE